MKLVYYHKGTTLTIERLGIIDNDELAELLAKSSDNRISITAMFDDGNVFNGTLEELLTLSKLSGQITRTRIN